MTVLIGVQIHPAAGETGARQEQALKVLGELSGVERVNLQFARDWTSLTHDRFDTLSVLEQDSLTVTGLVEGTRKPIISELCAVLAAEAVRRNCEYFCFTNSDILVSQAAIDEIEGRKRDGYAFSRMDIDPRTGEELGIVLEGMDVIAVRASWWRLNAHRFRAFIVGEPCWDSQYTSTMVRYSDAVILNVRPLIRHVAHPKAWSHTSPFARYNGYLTALDARLFSLWCEYHALRAAWPAAAGRTAEEENFTLQRATLRRPWPIGSDVLQAARSVKAWVSYGRARRRFSSGARHDNVIGPG